MAVKPIGNRILVEIKNSEEKTSGGIVIPQTAQEKTQEGIVIAVGDSDEITVKEGSRVIYDKYAGTEIKIDGKEHLLIKSDDILAMVE